MKTPISVSQKSIAKYYYTKTRPATEIAQEHNTHYVNTEGVQGQIKTFSNGVKAFIERVNGIFKKK